MLALSQRMGVLAELGKMRKIFIAEKNQRREQKIMQKALEKCLKQTTEKINSYDKAKTTKFYKLYNQMNDEQKLVIHVYLFNFLSKEKNESTIENYIFNENYGTMCYMQDIIIRNSKEKISKENLLNYLFFKYNIKLKTFTSRFTIYDDTNDKKASAILTLSEKNNNFYLIFNINDFENKINIKVSYQANTKNQIDIAMDTIKIILSQTNFQAQKIY